MRARPDRLESELSRASLVKDHHPTGQRTEFASKRGGFALPLTIVLFALLTVGAVNLYSASGGGSLFYTQLKHIPIGVFAFLVCGWVIKPRHLSTYAYALFGITCALLVGVLVMGEIGGGSRRWLEIGSLRAQPSEFAKITVALVTARFFSTFGLDVTYDLRNLWPLGLLIAMIAGLIFPQPDLGTATFCLMIVCTQLCFVRIQMRSIFVIAAIGAVLVPLVWQFMLMDYQKFRILSFLNPALDPQGKGYNSLQSLIAIGSGGLWGKGFMNGTQTQLRFLPMSHSDFIFSVFAEEHGFVGAALLVTAFASIGYMALEVARESRQAFSSLVAVGIGALIFLEFAINVAMVLRMMPVKGLPLPFMSYGGSHLVTTCAALGLLVGVDRENRQRFSKLQSEVGRY